MKVQCDHYRHFYYAKRSQALYKNIRKGKMNEAEENSRYWRNNPLKIFANKNCAHDNGVAVPA